MSKCYCIECGEEVGKDHEVFGSKCLEDQSIIPMNTEDIKSAKAWWGMEEYMWWTPGVRVWKGSRERQ